MRKTFTPLAAAAALLAACGGGSDTTMPAKTQAAPAERAQALATVGAKEAFDWAAYKYPALFPGGSANFPLPYQGVTYTVRSHANGNFLGMTANGDLFGYGPFTDNVLAPLGNLSAYVALIQADSCIVYPGSCGGGAQPPGPLNECTMPAAQALATGNRLLLRYATTGALSGETDIDGIVDGPATFEGQSAIRTSATITNRYSFAGTLYTDVLNTKSYEQIADGGFIRTLGDESESGVAGAVTRSRTVYNPGRLNAEFGLAAGQSFAYVYAGTTTSTSPITGTTTNTFSDTENHSYEARETITVRGKAYDTCRYRLASPSAPTGYALTWYVVGKGVSVRSQNVDGTDIVVTELVSGSINGAPI